MTLWRLQIWKVLLLMRATALKVFLGYSANEVIGKLGAQYVHSEDLGMVQAKLSSLLTSSGKAITLEHRACHKNWFRQMAGINGN